MGFFEMKNNNRIFLEICFDMSLGLVGMVTGCFLI